MALITDYDSLKTNIGDWLNRSDLTAVIPNFIQLAEGTLARDRRVREISCRGTWTITADGDALPADFRELDAWYHDGNTYFGEIEIVPAEVLPLKKVQFGTTGVPRYAAILDGKLYYAPAPDTTYSTKMSYWRKILPLSASRATNWLLEDHPDIYLYASLVESAPYLKDDQRVDVWGALLEKKLNELHDWTWDRHWSGTMRRHVRNPIGG